MGECGLGDDVVGDAVGELRERVGRERRDHVEIGALKVRIELGRRLPSGERVERLGPHEAVGAGRHQRDDLVARANEQPHQLTRLVGGDSPGDTDQDARHWELPTSCTRA